MTDLNWEDEQGTQQTRVQVAHKDVDQLKGG